MSKREEYEYLLERSRRFYESALIQIEKGFYDLAAFSLEQSLQLFLKACLLRLGIDYPRAHSVRKLLEFIHSTTSRKEVGDLIQRYSVELGALEDAYISSRYIARDYRADEVERLKEIVERIAYVLRQTAC